MLKEFCLPLLYTFENISWRIVVLLRVFHLPEPLILSSFFFFALHKESFPQRQVATGKGEEKPLKNPQQQELKNSV